MTETAEMWRSRTGSPQHAEVRLRLSQRHCEGAKFRLRLTHRHCEGAEVPTATEAISRRKGSAAEAKVKAFSRAASREPVLRGSVCSMYQRRMGRSLTFSIRMMWCAHGIDHTRDSGKSATGSGTFETLLFRAVAGGASLSNDACREGSSRWKASIRSMFLSENPFNSGNSL